MLFSEQCQALFAIFSIFKTFPSSFGKQLHQVTQQPPNVAPSTRMANTTRTSLIHSTVLEWYLLAHIRRLFHSTYYPKTRLFDHFPTFSFIHPTRCANSFFSTNRFACSFISPFRLKVARFSSRISAACFWMICAICTAS